jgi:lipopolysaccharide export system permease protein
MIAFSVLGFPRTTRQSRALSLVAVIAGIAGLRLAGFAATAMAYNVPITLVVIYFLIALAIAGGGVLVWRGISLDLDEKINLREMTQNAVLRLEHLAARFHIRLPTRNLLRQLANSE